MQSQTVNKIGVIKRRNLFILKCLGDRSRRLYPQLIRRSVLEQNHIRPQTVLADFPSIRKADLVKDLVYPFRIRLVDSLPDLHKALHLWISRKIGALRPRVLIDLLHLKKFFANLRVLGLGHRSLTSRENNQKRNNDSHTRSTSKMVSMSRTSLVILAFGKLFKKSLAYDFVLKRESRIAITPRSVLLLINRPIPCFSVMIAWGTL